MLADQLRVQSSGSIKRDQAGQVHLKSGRRASGTSTLKSPHYSSVRDVLPHQALLASSSVVRRRVLSRRAKRLRINRYRNFKRKLPETAGLADQAVAARWSRRALCLRTDGDRHFKRKQPGLGGSCGSNRDGELDTYHVAPRHQLAPQFFEDLSVALRRSFSEPYKSK